MHRLYYPVIAFLLMFPWVLVILQLVAYLGSRWRRRRRPA